MRRLSSLLENIKDHYTVVVVGSGYGGAIAASRMARANQSVCLLERGKELVPGEFPDTDTEALAEMQVDLPEKHIGDRTGLYDFRLNKDINVFLGCGLGGTSLVNANVSLRPDPRLFDDPCWPPALRADVSTRLNDGFQRAEEMLKPATLPANITLRKLEAHQKSAAALKLPFKRTPINVTFETHINHVGVEQPACNMCGDCVSGCNHGSKNTVLMNYLPDAVNHGAEIYTQVSVRRIERANGRWLVHFENVGSGRDKFDAPDLFVSADVVILSAGTLGSTEILLRSRAAGLTLSPRLGERFTGNGDVLGFGYNTDEVINGVGFGERVRNDPVGPCITSVIDARQESDPTAGMVIEEGSMPGGLATFVPAAMATASTAVGSDTDSGDLVSEKARELDSLLRGPYRGAVRNTQTYLVMTHDDSGGRMRLQGDRLRIDWPGVGAQPIFQRVNERLLGATKALGGTFVPNPAWSKLESHNLITVHPLGGCVMAERTENGVVDHKGQVFSGTSGAAVHSGLYVSDGAVMPRSLGVNPLLTISAVTERCCALLAADRGWTIDYRLPSAPAAPAATKAVGIEFTETMSGGFSTKVKSDYEAAAARGAADKSTLRFVLTISSEKLDKMLADPNHEARMVGTVEAPELSPQPLAVTKGVFHLFSDDPEHAGTRNMRYRMRLTASDGRRFFFTGFKVIRDDQKLEVWSDTTTLYVDVYAGDDESGALVGKGILKIAPDDFRRQLTTMKATNADNAAERLAAVAAFGRVFAGALVDTYGGVFARPSVFDPTAPPRKKRSLRVPAPSMHSVTTADGVGLRLTRYQGGSKGPVILSHGLGVSSLIFSTDTIDTNLLEYLVAHGYDVWLLDYRASIELPASLGQFSADDIATRDYPAAVEAVRQLTGAASVQVVAHCFGATTFVMAMLAGLKGVRSAVCSQIGPHVVTPTTTKIKAGLHLSSVIESLGVSSLTAYTDAHADWQSRLLDNALRAYPVEKGEACASPVCHRITFIYALLYEHERLNTLTHNTLHEMFGIANVRALDHLGKMVRAGTVVDAAGNDTYMPHLDRMNIPLAFIHGAENACFLPESTQRSYEALRAVNGPSHYWRHVIPNYGHIDCIFGANAAKDVYPYIVEHLARG